MAARSVDFVEKVGDVLLEQGKLEEALKVYRNCHTVRERLAAVDHSNADWQRNQAMSLNGW